MGKRGAYTKPSVTYPVDVATPEDFKGVASIDKEVKKTTQQIRRFTEAGRKEDAQRAEAYKQLLLAANSKHHITHMSADQRISDAKGYKEGVKKDLAKAKRSLDKAFEKVTHLSQLAVDSNRDASDADGLYDAAKKALVEKQEPKEREPKKGRKGKAPQAK